MSTYTYRGYLFTDNEYLNYPGYLFIYNEYP